MIFVVAVVLLFVAVSIYFFFRAETLQRELLEKKRESTSTKNENKALIDAMALVANRYEEFAKYRLQHHVEQEKLDEKHLTLITPLINNYAVIFRESLKGKGQLKAVVKKCYESTAGHSFSEFDTYIRSQNATIKRMWNNNNLNGFISLVEALLQWQEVEVEKEKSKLPNKKTMP